MFYKIHAYNSNTLYAWATNPSDVARYVDWLNVGRDVNVYAAREVAQADVTAEIEAEALSCDETGWDNFMADGIEFQHVELDEGGYDESGSYWGVGAPLYLAFLPDGDTEYFRADNIPPALARAAAAAGIA